MRDAPLSDPSTPRQSRQLRAHMQAVTRRFRSMNKFFFVALVFCFIALLATEFIPDSVSGTSTIWLRLALDSVFSSLLSAAIVLLLFDYYDINNEFSYMKDVTTSLLEMHQNDDYINRIIDTVMMREDAVKGMGATRFNEVLTALVKGRYGLEDSPEDTAYLQSTVAELENKYNERFAHLETDSDTLQ